MHLLVSCAKLCNAMVLSYQVFGVHDRGLWELWKSIVHNFAHQVFGTVAGDCSSFEQAFGNISARIRQQHQVFGVIAQDCSSLDNWRFILLLRLGIYFFSKILKRNSRVSWWFVEVWLAEKPCLISLDRDFNLSSQELVDFYQSCFWSSDLLRLGWPLAMSSVLDRNFLWKLGWLWSHV